MNENNIQDYVSNITSKFMPIDLPQWQIVLIPSTGSGDNMVGEVKTLYLHIRNFTQKQIVSEHRKILHVCSSTSPDIGRRAGFTAQ